MAKPSPSHPTDAMLLYAILGIVAFFVVVLIIVWFVTAVYERISLAFARRGRDAQRARPYGDDVCLDGGEHEWRFQKQSFIYVICLKCKTEGIYVDDTPLGSKCERPEVSE